MSPSSPSLSPFHRVLTLSRTILRPHQTIAASFSIIITLESQHLEDILLSVNQSHPSPSWKHRPAVKTESREIHLHAHTILPFHSSFLYWSIYRIDVDFPNEISRLRRDNPL
jgi:hypothetical protein